MENTLLIWYGMGASSVFVGMIFVPESQNYYKQRAKNMNKVMSKEEKPTTA